MCVLSPESQSSRRQRIWAGASTVRCVLTEADLLRALPGPWYGPAPCRVAGGWGGGVVGKNMQSSWGGESWAGLPAAKTICILFSTPEQPMPSWSCQKRLWAQPEGRIFLLWPQNLISVLSLTNGLHSARLLGTRLLGRNGWPVVPCLVLLLHASWCTTVW